MFFEHGLGIPNSVAIANVSAAFGNAAAASRLKVLGEYLLLQLLEEDLLWLGGEEPFLLIESRIIGYRKGSAFKRWMMPGWGATELSIRCELKDDKNNVVGKAASIREVFAGG